VLEYANAIFWQTLLTWRIFLTRGFDIIQGCNPPDNIFLVLAIQAPGKKYIFDQHDISPEVLKQNLAAAVFFIEFCFSWNGALSGGGCRWSRMSLSAR
jgi:hypothetical protein